VIDWIWEKKTGLSALSVHIKSVIEQGFSTNSHSTTKCLKHYLNFKSVENVWSLNVVKFEFELRHIFNYSLLSYLKELSWALVNDSTVHSCKCGKSFNAQSVVLCIVHNFISTYWLLSTKHLFTVLLDTLRCMSLNMFVFVACNKLCDSIFNKNVYELNHGWNVIFLG